MRSILALIIVSFAAVAIGGCTFEHKDYHYDRRHGDACYRPPPHYYDHHYDYDRGYRDPYCR